MNILYSTSDSYAFLTGISIISLLENNKKSEKINIYIMDNHITSGNKNKLGNIVKKYNRNIFFVTMPDMEKKIGYKIDTKRWNISTFGRLYMASALPESENKVLNIDCDTIILDSLENIWNTDMNEKVFGGIQECINKRYRRNVGLKNTDYYMNGGIVLLNLEEVRKNNYEKLFTDYIIKYGSSLAYLDQDVLNSVIPQVKKKLLPMRYNVLSIYYYTNYEQLLKIRRASKKIFYNKEQFLDAKKNPAIVHFTSCFLDGVRPWIKGNCHPYRNKFLEYKDMSPWKEIPLLEDKRKKSDKIKTEIMKKLPKFIMCEIATILHGIIIPNKNYIKMKKRKINENV